MEINPKLIIFDWGWTLHDPESDSLFEGVEELIKKLSAKYILAIVSLAKSEPPEQRLRKIETGPIGKYFKHILVGGEDKNEMYEKVLTDLNLKPEEALVVDDRMIRGIAWGNGRGVKTIWLKKGKFSAELPTEETGQPTHTISDIKELDNLLT